MTRWKAKAVIAVTTSDATAARSDLSP